MAPQVVILGSIGLDDLATPFGRKKNLLGGSATYACLASSFFAETGMVAVAGTDLPKEYIEFFKAKGIDTRGLQIKKGKTLHWDAEYGFDLNSPETKGIDLGVSQGFMPVLPEEYREADYLFLGNQHPDIQLHVLSQMKRRPKLVMSDTMNFYIKECPGKVKEVVRAVDIALMNDGEARMLFNTPNLIHAAQEILKLDSDVALIKKGEHGSILMTKKAFFAAPAYPLANLADPTGAGDSFGGALIGYLAKTGEVNEKSLRKAIVYASSVASLNAEGFSIEKLKAITMEDIRQRYKRFKDITHF